MIEWMKWKWTRWNQNFFQIIIHLHCKKGLTVFPSPAGMSLTKLSLAGNNLPSSSPRKVWSKRTQESRRFFYSALVNYFREICPLQYLLCTAIVHSWAMQERSVFDAFGRSLLWMKDNWKMMKRLMSITEQIQNLFNVNIQYWAIKNRPHSLVLKALSGRIFSNVCFPL